MGRQKGINTDMVNWTEDEMQAVARRIKLKQAKDAWELQLKQTQKQSKNKSDRRAASQGLHLIGRHEWQDKANVYKSKRIKEGVSNPDAPD